MSVKPKNIKYIVARYVCAVICVYVPPTLVVRPNHPALHSRIELHQILVLERSHTEIYG